MKKAAALAASLALGIIGYPTAAHATSSNTPLITDTQLPTLAQWEKLDLGWDLHASDSEVEGALVGHRAHAGCGNSLKVKATGRSTTVALIPAGNSTHPSRYRGVSVSVHDAATLRGATRFLAGLRTLGADCDAWSTLDGTWQVKQTKAPSGAEEHHAVKLTQTVGRTTTTARYLAYRQGQRVIQVWNFGENTRPLPLAKEKRVVRVVLARAR